MSNMTVKVEFMWGTWIKEAIQEAKEKAIEWDVAFVEFDFNGAMVKIGQSCDVDKAIEKWDEIKGSGKSLVA